MKIIYLALILLIVPIDSYAALCHLNKATTDITSDSFAINNQDWLDSQMGYINRPVKYKDDQFGALAVATGGHAYYFDKKDFNKRVAAGWVPPIPHRDTSIEVLKLLADFQDQSITVAGDNTLASLTLLLFSMSGDTEIDFADPTGKIVMAGADVERDAYPDFCKVTLKKPLPGNWQIQIRGAGKLGVYVVGESNTTIRSFNYVALLFGHEGLSFTPFSDLNDIFYDPAINKLSTTDKIAWKMIDAMDHKINHLPGDINKAALEGHSYAAEIEMNAPNREVDSFEMLSLDGKLLQSFNILPNDCPPLTADFKLPENSACRLAEYSPGTYIVQSVLFPTETAYIYALGKDIQGNAIRRMYPKPVNRTVNSLRSEIR